MNTQKSDRRNMADIGIGRDDRELMNKKGLTIEDVKGVMTDRTMSSGKNGGEFAMMAAGLIFGLLLIVTGIFIALTTYYSIFGVVAGLVMIIAGFAVAYFGFTRKPKQVVGE